MVIKVDLMNFASEVLHSEKIVLADFYADWCSPCQMQAPILEEFANENENVTVAKINSDESLDLSMTYGIMSIPTLVVFKNGKEVKWVSGVHSKEELLELVNSIEAE